MPVNSLTADKARLFNKNIEGLYSEFGSADELDRFEGTGKLDTVYMASAKELNLQTHYNIDSSGESWYKAALRLRKNSRVAKSAYGELKVKVWDKDKNKAALICNTLLQKIQTIHQGLQNRGNLLILERLKENYESQWRSIYGDTLRSKAADADVRFDNTIQIEQLHQYQRLINEYGIAVVTNPPTLLVVEHGQPAMRHDKPKTLQVVLLTFFASLAFTVLLAVFMESRKQGG